MDGGENFNWDGRFKILGTDHKFIFVFYLRFLDNQQRFKLYKSAVR